MNKSKEAGITLISLVITIIVLMILTFSITTNLKNNADLQKLVNLRGDIENLTQKVNDFYDEYGEIPASIEYTNISHLSDVLNSVEKVTKFYVIDLQAMQGVSLHYGKDYEIIKNIDPERTTISVNDYEDVYIINEQTHNIFYVQGISIQEDKKTKKYYYTDHEKVENIAGTNVANPPEMLEGMQKAMFIEPTNTAKGKVVLQNEEDFDDSQWYSYETKKWANAQTKDGSMWVWIPRFAYKIETEPSYTEGETTTGGTIKVKFLIGTTDNYYDDDGSLKTAQRQKSDVEIINPNKEYTVHPAFTNESTISYANGGWDKELSGIWVAKFEAGYSTEEDITSNADPVFQGLKYSMNNVSQQEAFNIAKALVEENNKYGLSKETTDSHLMKNSEWGAVAYLSQSQYGLDGQNISDNYVSLQSINNPINDKQQGINSIYGITGVTSGEANVKNLIVTTMEDINNVRMNLPDQEGVYTWHQQNGQSASTTGTIHGIYDLSGGLNELVSACVSDEESTKYIKAYKKANTDLEDEDKMQQANYSENTQIYGDAIFETSTKGTENSGWYQDTSKFIGKTALYMLRGGSISESSYENGLYAFNSTDGNSAYNIGFRAVLVAK